MSTYIKGALAEWRNMEEENDRLKNTISRLREQLNEAHAANTAVHARKGPLATQQAELVDRVNNLINEKNSLEIQLANVTLQLDRAQDNGELHAIRCNELEIKLLNTNATSNRQRANAQRRAQRQQKYIDWLRSQNELLQNISGFGNQPRDQQDSARLKDPALREALTDAVTKDLKP